MTSAGSEPAASEATSVSRVERRKAQARQRLIDAARVMLAAGTAAQASIQEITDAADIGFGSFYTHFATKNDLFEAAVDDVLEELGQSFDLLSVDVDDAAMALAQAERLTLRLCRSRPQISAVLVRHYMHVMDSDSGVARRLLRDIQAGMASGRFTGGGSATGPRGDVRGGAGHPADGADAIPRWSTTPRVTGWSNSCCACWAYRPMRRTSWRTRRCRSRSCPNRADPAGDRPRPPRGLSPLSAVRLLARSGGLRKRGIRGNTSPSQGGTRRSTVRGPTARRRGG